MCPIAHPDRLTVVAVVSVLSLKGGVGKTSVVLGLAGAATVRGLATLVIDLDPQGNATSLLKSHKTRTTVADGGPCFKIKNAC